MNLSIVRAVLVDMTNDTGTKKGAPITELVANFISACRTSVRSEENTIGWNHLELEGAGRGVRLHWLYAKVVY